MSVESRLDEAFAPEQATALPALLSEGPEAARRAVTEEPALTNDLMDEVDQADVAEAARRSPEVVEDVQRLLWAVHSEKVERYPSLESAIGSSVAVSYRASDSPLEGHMETDAYAGELSGGPEAHSDPDLTLEGGSDVLAGLLTGSSDPVRCYEKGEISVDGSLNHARTLADALRRVTRRL